MNTARIVVLTIAIGAGGIAADPASGSDNKPAAPAFVAKSDIGLGQTEANKPTNPAKASTSSGTAGVVSPQMMQK
jgi:hypothetical protein